MMYAMNKNPFSMHFPETCKGLRAKKSSLIHSLLDKKQHTRASFFFGGASNINLGFLQDRFCSLVLAAWTIDLFGHCGREPQR